MASDVLVPLFGVNMSPQAVEAATRVLTSGQVAEGPRVVEFEKTLAYIFGLSHRNLDVVAVNSGTTAIELALLLAGVGLGDDVLTTPMTCTATTTAIINRGARPVWVDVDPETGNLDPDDLTRRRTPATRAVVVVEWAGHPVDTERVRMATASGLPIIEDAAHSFTVHGGFQADFRCFSFQAIKFLTTGDGGAVVMDKRYADRARRLRWFGLDRSLPREQRFDAPQTETGFKWHMNDLAAAIGNANVNAATQAVERCKVNAAFYAKALAGVTRNGRVAFPPANGFAAWWLYTIRVDDRKAFQTFMARRGIETSEVHRRNDRIEAFAKIAGETKPGDFPALDIFAAGQVSVPVGWWLTEAQRRIVANALIDYIEAR